MGGETSRSVAARWLSRLDHMVLDRRWSSRWLLAASIAGVLLALVGAIGYFVGGGGGSTAEPFSLGVFLCVMPLVEIWMRRQRSNGKEPFRVLRRLDERVLGRKR